MYKDFPTGSCLNIKYTEHFIGKQHVKAKQFHFKISSAKRGEEYFAGYIALEIACWCF